MKPMCCFAQDLSQFRKDNPVTVSGNFNGGVNYLEAENSTVEPLGYHASLNLQFSFFSVLQVPVSLSYGNYGSSINTLSFRRFGISPSYKYVKLHGGYRSYQLSPYIMAGMTVLGGGIELSPKKFYFQAFAGKLVDRYNLGGDFLQFRDETIDFYQRNVYGAKTGFGKSTHRYSLMIFHAKDKSNTGTIDSLTKYNITPKENVIAGAEIYHQYFKLITLHLTGAASILTNNTEGKPLETDESGEKWVERFSFLTTVNATSRYAFAYDGRISIRIKSLNIGMKYQHIDPNYASLGVAFLQTNFNNYLFDIQGSLFKNKCIIFSNFGIQELHSNEVTGQRQKRIVSNTNINWNFNKSLALQASYNNLAQNTETQILDVADSLRLTTRSQGWNIGWTIKPGKQKEKPHSLILQASRNIFDLIQNDLSLSTNTNFNGNIAYRFNLKNNWNLTATLNYNDFTIGDGRVANRYGLILGYGKNINENLNARLQGSYKLNFTDEVQDGYVVNAGLNIQWKINKKHQLLLGSSALWRQTTLQNPKEEWRWRANYSYSF
jgi:hypothetical protein